MKFYSFRKFLDWPKIVHMLQFHVPNKFYNEILE